MEMEATTLNDVITLRCVGLLFYNFKQEDIKHLREASKEFDQLWGELLVKAKKKKWFSIPDTEFYNVFCNCNYETQGEIIKRAKWRYLPEASHSVSQGLKDLEFFRSISDG